MPSIQEIGNTYIPLISAVISLVSVSIAFVTLWYSRRDRFEQQQASAADARRREQEMLLGAFQREKEAVGFMAWQLARQPSLVTSENRERLFSALLLAFIFEKSDRARAFVLKALRQFAKRPQEREEVCQFLREVKQDFEKYEEALETNELAEYRERIDKLSEILECK